MNNYGKRNASFEDRKKLIELKIALLKFQTNLFEDLKFVVDAMDGKVFNKRLATNMREEIKKLYGNIGYVFYNTEYSYSIRAYINYFEESNVYDNLENIINTDIVRKLGYFQSDLLSTLNMNRDFYIYSGNRKDVCDLDDNDNYRINKEKFVKYFSDKQDKLCKEIEQLEKSLSEVEDMIKDITCIKKLFKKYQDKYSVDGKYSCNDVHRLFGLNYELETIDRTNYLYTQLKNYYDIEKETFLNIEEI